MLVLTTILRLIEQLGVIKARRKKSKPDGGFRIRLEVDIDFY